jgi:hypothetical protein
MLHARRMDALAPIHPPDTRRRKVAATSRLQRGSFDINSLESQLSVLDTDNSNWFWLGQGVGEDERTELFREFLPQSLWTGTAQPSHFCGSPRHSHCPRRQAGDTQVPTLGTRFPEATTPRPDSQAPPPNRRPRPRRRRRRRRRQGSRCPWRAAQAGVREAPVAGRLSPPLLVGSVQ